VQTLWRLSAKNSFQNLQRQDGSNKEIVLAQIERQKAQEIWEEVRKAAEIKKMCQKGQGPVPMALG